MEEALDLSFIKMTYRYEVLLALVLTVGVFWWLAIGTQAFIATFTIVLVLLTARSLSQYKRNTEDFTAMDIALARIPFRYELLLVIAVIIWILWAIAAGTVGFMLGLGIVFLALIARSVSQLKRNAATTVSALEL
ncbi:hypothetical protein DVJ83_16015 (plasmid) [Deinococcus wulumuqiensis]|uniref:Uncharacterized protein n=1 Tax=Deinococcus wulumuqiensis TaxID=980427 RepID=A0A345ILT7_9DEIO|nr:hypothetical protein [Deinococcus wulumuqiensis]AXH00660.1 hypothetical protein DVJ83_16015 [Deinococcus wulumuqiensis]